jgi:hypothetical protein
MFTRMQLAKTKDFTQLVVESGSKLLIDMVNWSCKLNGKTPTPIRRIHELTDLQWQVCFISIHGVKAIEA